MLETQRRRRRGSTTGGNAEVLTGVSYVGSWKFPRDRRRLRRGATLVKAGRVEGLASVCRHRRRRRSRRFSLGDARSLALILTGGVEDLLAAVHGACVERMRSVRPGAGAGALDVAVAVANPSDGRCLSLCRY